MGTNYYWHEDQCEHCRRTSKPIHIGKSSMGWAFSLHVGREWDDTPKDLDDWLVQFQKPGSVIMDEYDRVITVEDMIKTITERDDYRPSDDKPLRHHIEDRQHCLKAFYDKSYDYCIGEYS